MEKILIKTETINLDQLLKWASIVDSGGIVKFMIEDQLIKVNGEVVTQRRKKIYPGDIIEIIDSGQWEVQREFGE
ncbi:MAG: RNA-binding S4 domain-containing protein [Negativicutes bacterium]|jgi:ribosome-associated protein|nr:RNA-binding S4 domain-containing protein [Negativicutes bacterium]MBP8629137.1 RNA-binding S4 domain-containing protein [Negativicutes bacterium]MBP9537314.1 RNA-binding S4 domain-containing protein [Negativicutes bacterium]MBP9949310.1 RNA-binding S4 domain-containing protein [Negativicutes bacterium]